MCYQLSSQHRFFKQELIRIVSVFVSMIRVVSDLVLNSSLIEYFSFKRSLGFSVNTLAYSNNSLEVPSVVIDAVKEQQHKEHKSRIQR